MEGKSARRGPANYGPADRDIGAKIQELAHNHKDLFTTERESTITIASP
jgi:hypothetical protein